MEKYLFNKKIKEDKNNKNGNLLLQVNVSIF